MTRNLQFKEETPASRHSFLQMVSPKPAVLYLNLNGDVWIGVHVKNINALFFKGNILLAMF